MRVPVCLPVSAILPQSRIDCQMSRPYMYGRNMYAAFRVGGRYFEDQWRHVLSP
jgi:hypothetical protein|eukprot:COSAG01_NODE_3264_length_6333_cov_2.641219_3_plen_54_part_00